MDPRKRVSSVAEISVPSLCGRFLHCGTADIPTTVDSVVVHCYRTLHREGHRYRKREQAEGMPNDNLVNSIVVNLGAHPV